MTDPSAYFLWFIGFLNGLTLAAAWAWVLTRPTKGRHTNRRERKRTQHTRRVHSGMGRKPLPQPIERIGMTSASKARHRAATERRGWKRKVVGVPTIGILLIAGVAIALLLLRGGFTGSVTGGNWDLILSGTPGDISTTGDCVASRTGNFTPGASGVAGQVSLTWAGVVPDDDCVVTATYLDFLGTPNTTDVRVQGFVAPAGLTATLGASCGATIAPSGQAVASVTLTYLGDPTSITFDPALHGFEFVRAQDYDPLLCT